MLNKNYQRQLLALFFLATMLFVAPLAHVSALMPTIPTATSFTTAVPVNRQSLIQLQGTDVDGTPLAFATVTIPSHGTLSSLNTTTGYLVYTPTASYVGPDSFTYTVTSGGETSAAATVTVLVTNSKTRIVETLTNPDGTPRVGKVTFILTQQVTTSAGITPAGSSVSAVLDASGKLNVSVFPSRGMSPEAYYQVWFENAANLKTEFMGIYDIPASLVTVMLSPNRVTDTNLAAKYTFVSLASLQPLLTVNANATIAQLLTGTHTENKLQKWNAATGFIDTNIIDSGTNLTLGKNTAVIGDASATGNISAQNGVTGIRDADVPPVLTNKALPNAVLTTPTISGATATGGTYNAPTLVNPVITNPTITGQNLSGATLTNPAVNGSVQGNLNVTGVISGNASGLSNMPGTPSGPAYSSLSGDASSWAKYQANGGGIGRYDLFRNNTSVFGADATGKIDVLSFAPSLRNTLFGNILDAVRDYSVPTNGITNAEPSIQSALDGAAAAGGGIVMLPRGTYKINNALIVPSNVVLMGAGRGLTKITPATGDLPGKTVNGASVYASIAMVGADRAGVVGITVDHTTYGTHANGIALIPEGAGYNGTPTRRSIVRECEVKQVNSHQYAIWNLRGQYNKILNNWVDGGVTSLDNSSEQEGIESYGGLDVLIDGNTIVNTGASGITLEAGGGGITDSTLKSVRVVNSFITGARVGINLLCEASQSCEDITFATNHIIGSRMTGITGLVEAGGVLKNLHIAFNTIQEARDEGIRLYGTATSSFANIDVQDNQIEFTASPAVAMGILISDYQHARLRGNTVKGARIGILALNETDLQISDNTINTTKDSAVVISNGTDVFIRHNDFRKFNAGNSNNAGVYVESVTRGGVNGNTFSTDFDYYPVQIPSGDQIGVSNNRLLYATALSRPFANDATNPNSATFNLLGTSATINNTLVTPDAQILIIQESGTPTAFTVSKGLNAFTVTTAVPMTGVEQFRYDIQ